MSTNRKESPKISTVKNKEQAQYVPSKYTYAHVATFHRTVLAILSQKKLTKLRVSDITTILDFIIILADLVDSPIILNERSKKKQKNSNTKSSADPFPKIKGLGVLSRSEKCLVALVTWMREVITIQDLTMEIVLEEYYTKFPYALKPPVVSDVGYVMPDTPNNTDKKNSGKP
ncbi:hypothetical protein [Pedobacter hartonius]|uniref:Uncharacterized protein n=1 Tax=Pedobacter hartonius TaxID=425514 RepID=A0A1H4BY01_9SPHI|nr:hypothetical protein [Pedobacter hartonius]SEA52712.1 hypothetical protein SAMN05443550_103503 [Pedobacter hartonius]